MKSLSYLAPAFLSLAGTALASPAPSCRCRPSEPCWPSDAKWKALNSSIAGNLVSVKPVASVCHDPFFDDAACKKVHSSYRNSVWRAEQPGAVQFPSWEFIPEEGQTCYVDTPRNSPCKQGRVSLYSAIVHTPEQIQAAVRFAGENNIRLVVKNTGHDFLGRSAAPDSLQILTHNMNNVDLTDNFVPRGKQDGVGVGSAVTIGAGVYLDQLYQKIRSKGKMAVAGFSHTVGAAGGYIQGGGHSPLGTLKGMASDNALEFQVITADVSMNTGWLHSTKRLY